MEWEESCFFQLNTPTFHGGLTHFKSLNQSVVAIATVKEVYFAKIIRSYVLFIWCEIKMQILIFRPHFDWKLIPFFKMEATQIVSLTAFNKNTSDGVEGLPMLALVVIQQVFDVISSYIPYLILIREEMCYTYLERNTTRVKCKKPIMTLMWR